MGIDRATRDVLRDIALFPALAKGDPDLARVRRAYDEVFAAWTAPPPGPTEETWETAGALTSLTIRPLNSGGGTGTILFIHGGGWSLGGALCYAPLGRHLAATAGMRVMLPDFPQSPEATFPAAPDALAAWAKAVVEHADGPVFVAGDSAGGNLAAVLSHEPGLLGRFTGQGLLYPVMDLRPDAKYRSRRRYGDGKFFLSTDAIVGASLQYAGANGDPADPRLSPICRDDLSASPATFLLLPECDPLRDEGELYGQRLKKAGVTVETMLAPKTIHGCASFSGRLPQGRQAMERMAELFTAWAAR